MNTSNETSIHCYCKQSKQILLTLLWLTTTGIPGDGILKREEWNESVYIAYVLLYAIVMYFFLNSLLLMRPRILLPLRLPLKFSLLISDHFLPFSLYAFQRHKSSSSVNFPCTASGLSVSHQRVLTCSSVRPGNSLANSTQPGKSADKTEFFTISSSALVHAVLYDSGGGGYRHSYLT